MVHQSGDIIQRRYQILGRLGEGNTGITYLAKDQTTQKQVALKTLVLRQAVNWKTIELFEREAEILQQFNHPNIPKYLEYFVVETERDRNFYIVQELAKGKSLFDWVQQGWHGTEAEIRAIALQVLEILNYLHTLNPPVFHRDIKPQNLIRRADGQIFLVDFGSVGSTYHNTFMQGSTVVGTYGYMAPEQFRGQVVAATDLYGLGTTLLFLLTRRSPADLPVQKLRIEFRSQLQLSPHFADWLEKILEPAPKDRFASAEIAIAQLQPPPKQSSKLSIGIGAMSALTLMALVVTDHYRYAIINKVGLTQSAYTSIDHRDLSIKEYLSKGGDPNATDIEGRTLIYQAIALGEADSIQQIVAKGGNLQYRDHQGQTPLHEAAQRKPEALKAILALNQIDISLKDKKGKTAIDYINSEANAQLFVEHISRRSQIKDQKQQLIETLIQTASQRGWLNLVQSLTEGDVSTYVNLSEVFQRAVANSDAGVFRSMIAKQQKLTPDMLNQIHFHELKFLTPEEILELLPYADALDRGGNTLLNFLVDRVESDQDVQTIWKLLQVGANIHQSNLQGITPLKRASMGGKNRPMREAIRLAFNERAGVNPSLRREEERVRQQNEQQFERNWQRENAYPRQTREDSDLSNKLMGIGSAPSSRNSEYNRNR